MEIIKSASNEKIKHIIKLEKRSYREKCREFVIEGVRAVSDAVLNGAEISAVFYCIENPIQTSAPCYQVDEKIFKSISSTQTPQTVLAVVKMRENTTDFLNECSCLVFCDRIQDPGNLGTIIRTADSAGFDGVILAKGCVDLYNPKTVRSTMSSIFNLPIITIENTTDCLQKLRALGFNIVVGTLRETSVDLFFCTLRKKTVIIIGNEANGASDECILNSDTLVKIPMRGMSESLNAAVAGSIIMYEYLRQNREKIDYD